MARRWWRAVVCGAALWLCPFFAQGHATARPDTLVRGMDTLSNASECYADTSPLPAYYSRVHRLLVQLYDKSRTARIHALSRIQKLAERRNPYAAETIAFLRSQFPLHAASHKAQTEYIKLAIHGYRRSAKTGDPMAAYSLGTLYDASSALRFKAIDADATLARKWYLIAAKQALPTAEYRLGILDQDLAVGHSPSSPEALSARYWLFKAASAGIVRAMDALAASYMQTNEPVEAYSWARLARDRGLDVGSLDPHGYPRVTAKQIDHAMQFTKRLHKVVPHCDQVYSAR